MSEHWDFYFCQVEDKPASIFVNFDIAKEAPLETHTHMTYVRLHIMSPRDDGLPDKEELDTLKLIGDCLEADLTSDGSAVYVGRITCDGFRDLIFYSPHSPEWENRVEAAMRSFPARQFKAGSREDPEWKGYFDFLYPTDLEWQQIKNQHTREALEKSGDTLTRARRIDHLAYFPTEASRLAFIDAAQKLGFEVCDTSEIEDDKNPYCVEVFRVDAPETIDDVTHPLFELVKEHGGDYDGWGTNTVS